MLLRDLRPGLSNRKSRFAGLDSPINLFAGVASRVKNVYNDSIYCVELMFLYKMWQISAGVIRLGFARSIFGKTEPKNHDFSSGFPVL